MVGLLTIEDAKSESCKEIDHQGDQCVRIAKRVLDNPEPGYREYKTSSLIAGEFAEMGIPFEERIAITGVKGILDTGRPGPTVAVIGELDSHIVRGHPNSDPETDAAHACGHHTQLGMLLAVAKGIQAPGVMDILAGRIALMAVPAEEYIEIEYRNQLRKMGKVEFLVGKSEFIRLGKFDDVDMAMMTHTDIERSSGKFSIGGTFNGMVAKLVHFAGVSAHAGSSPHLGVNALNAATVALQAVHAQRETFREEDSIRVHPIITRGGGAVSAVPDDVGVETFVRGKTIESIFSAAQKMDRSFKSGALAMGASVNIITIPGYLPKRNSSDLETVHADNAIRLVGEQDVIQRGHETGSSDIGDLSNIMPIAHPFIVSASGKPHGVDYIVEDYELAVLTSAKAMAGTVIDLLSNGAKRAHALKESYNPPLSKRDYLETIRGFSKDETFSY